MDTIGLRKHLVSCSHAPTRPHLLRGTQVILAPTDPHPHTHTGTHCTCHPVPKHLPFSSHPRILIFHSLHHISISLPHISFRLHLHLPLFYMMSKSVFHLNVYTFFFLRLNCQKLPFAIAIHTKRS